MENVIKASNLKGKWNVASVHINASKNMFLFKLRKVKWNKNRY